MAIDEGDRSDAGDFASGEASDSASADERAAGSDSGSDSESGSSVRVGEYTWEDFMVEHGYGDDVSTLYPDDPAPDDDQLGLETGETDASTVPSGDDWEQVAFDPESYLGYHPDELTDRVLPIAGDNAETLWDEFLEYVDPETTPVVKDVWTWEHYKWEYYYEDDGSRPHDSDGEVVEHDEEDALGFDPDTLEERLSAGADRAMELDDVVEERTVNVQEDFDEDEFFSTADGATTLTNRYDLEKAVPMEKKTHFQEVERYWVNKPYACVVIFHSERENEKKYYLIEPYLNEIEDELQAFLSGKLRTAIKYSDDGIKEKADENGRRIVIEDETRRLLKRYDLYEKTAGSKTAGLLETVQSLLNDDEEDEDDGPTQLEGIEVRPEPAILEEDPDTLNEYQVEKLLYLLKRNFIGYERIDGIKHDINVEDISVDGYNSPVFVYHSDYEQIITNVYHGEDELDDFVVKLAQRSGKGISKRLPQVDATLPDGSRAQLTLGQEVSDHGTNYTIRQFKDVPFTPIDLINWNTFSLDEMAFLWLCIENHKSLIFAGGTASGKTTSLNAVSLFIPSSAKIVSIEDTREVELPQRNWIASVTRPSFSDDEQGDVDEFDLLEAALRQRPDYIVMGEIRGEEGRTLFQVMSTGHTTYTTFHADSVDEVLKRFTTDPINVSKTMFTALDLVSIQTQTRVQGRKVRRNKSLTEINHYEAENDEINVQDVYQWQAETDEYLKMGDSNTLEEIQFDRGWSREKLEEELFKRKVILAYLIKNGLNTYAEVAATAQAFINDPDTILTLIANGQLENSLEDLREMESVLIDVDQEKEELVPRPEATGETYNTSVDVLERAEESLFEDYRGKVPSGLASALGDLDEEEPIEVDGDDESFDDSIDDVDDGWGIDEQSTASTDDGFTTAGTDDQPAWITDDTNFDIGFDEGSSPTADDGASAQSWTAGADASSTAENAAEAGADSTASTAGSSGGDREISTGQFDMSPIETQSAAGGRSASSARQGAGSTADAESDPIVFSADDAPDDGGFGGLFDNMDETLNEMDEVDETQSSSDPVDADGAADEPVFTEGDSASIFDPEADAGPSFGDFTDELEDARPSASEPGTESESKSESESASDSNGASNAATMTATESAPADPEPEPESDTDSEQESEPEPPTIDIDEPSPSTDTDAADPAPGGGNETAETEAVTFDEDDIAADDSDGGTDDGDSVDDGDGETAEPAPPIETDAEPPTIDVDRSADQNDSDGTAADEANAETVSDELDAETVSDELDAETVSDELDAETVSDELDAETAPDETAASEGSESPTPSEPESESTNDDGTDSQDGDGESIFGPESDSIFSDDDAPDSPDEANAADESESLFGDSAETGDDSGDESDSIFDATGTESDDEETDT
ncbi:ATPase, T2SS/T4P/T4SS family [Halopiger xanaduensis]|uniref:Type II secretion system protein E n=1 Tax=Halopiger xanaduensis (strain DSM 18323 / JCM 14033 / SH-6) TaxID=797210 RepID=F8DC69_HALXS|nr:ATPase, T2SS/T4P/T4SS family [Halopiger xanaduensis]AEH37185.1 type II secretion system protein E [Halopiger xanaduensis SH-6]